MASLLYPSAKTAILNAGINFSSDTFNVCLLGSGYSYSTAHAAYGDVSGSEITGTGYTAGGAALTSQSVSNGVFTAANVSWTSSTITASYTAIYDTTASNALVALIDFGGSQSDTAGTFQIQWNSSGILYL
jgi:hypothetical protein